MEFTTEDKEILKRARAIRPECVFEPHSSSDTDRFKGYLWRNAGNPWGVGAAPKRADLYNFQTSDLFAPCQGGYAGMRRGKDLKRAILEGRILGLGDPGTEWIDKFAAEIGIPNTWRNVVKNTPPSPLPQTLPQGTRAKFGDKVYEFTGVAKFVSSAGNYHVPYLEIGTNIYYEKGSFPPSVIQWDTVPKEIEDATTIVIRRSEPGIVVSWTDPYKPNWSAETRAAYEGWTREQDKKHAQALAALDRRYGPMKNRDKYGQKIGGGWDSDDVE